MIVVVAAMGLLAWLVERNRRDRYALWGVAALFILLAIARGYYWNLFGRGHGPFTLNRISAAIVFLAVLMAPAIVDLIRRRRGAARRDR